MEVCGTGLDDSKIGISIYVNLPRECETGFREPISVCRNFRSFDETAKDELLKRGPDRRDRQPTSVAEVLRTLIPEAEEASNNMDFML